MLLVIAMVLFHSAECEDKPHLGRGFYLPDTPVYKLSDEGKSIFRNLPDSCFVKQTSTKNRARMLSFTNPGEFYRFVGEDLGLKQYQIMPRNLYKTLLYVSLSISTDLEVVGAGIEISRELSSTTLLPDCLSKAELSEDLVRDFKILADKIKKPSVADSWIEYQTFLRKYGTHYMKGMYSGNKVHNFVFAKKSSKYTVDQLSAAACLKLKNGGLTFCQFPDQTYREVAALKISEYYEVYGGTAETRLNMTVGDVTAGDLYKFIRSDTDEEQHIRVTLEPLTLLLKNRFLGTEYFSKALNLEQYYEGFVVKGCDEKSVGGVLTQRFRQISNLHSLPEYRCELAKTGCRSHNDCHLDVSSFWTHCYCYGKTCITSTRWSTAELGSYTTRSAQVSLHGSTYEGENMSCHYIFGPSCECDLGAHDQWDETWPGPKSDFSQDLQFYRQLYKNGVLFKNGAGGRFFDISAVLFLIVMMKLLMS